MVCTLSSTDNLEEMEERGPAGGEDRAASTADATLPLLLELMVCNTATLSRSSVTTSPTKAAVFGNQIFFIQMR
jgi:hypothetical protein